MASEAEFWKWSLSRWREAGVEAHLLKLQDQHNLVVLEVLMAAWLGSLGIRLTEADWRAMTAAADPWVAGVVLPLREQRVAWKAQPASAGLYSEVKKLELSAERSLATIYVEALTAEGSQLDRRSGSVDAVSSANSLQSPIASNLAWVLTRAVPVLPERDVDTLVELLAPTAT